MWRSVELREVRTFLVLADELHFGRTAERTGVTQSRVSQSLRELERKLGVALVRRTSRRVELTAAGVRLRGELAPALAGLEAVLRSMDDHGEPVRLGVVSAAAVGPEVQAVIDAYEPGVELVGLPFRDRFGPLRRGDVEVMVTTLPIVEPDLVTGPVLAREPRVLAVGRRHPLATRPSVSVEDLADHAVAELDILAPKSLHEAMSPRTTPSGRPIPRVRVAADEASNLIMAVASGRVVHPVTAAFARSYAHPDLRFVPIDDLPPSQSAFAWRRGNRNRALRAFLRVADEVRRPT